MTQPNYKCGHSPEITIIDSNPLSIAAWLDWKDTVGFDGDNTQCWECYCNKSNSSANQQVGTTKEVRKDKKQEKGINAKVPSNGQPKVRDADPTPALPFKTTNDILVKWHNLQLIKIKREGEEYPHEKFENQQWLSKEDFNSRIEEFSITKLVMKFPHEITDDQVIFKRGKTQFGNNLLHELEESIKILLRKE